jgi:hypothetical protein
MSNAISFENYSQLTHMTDEIQFVPNDWSRLEELGLFTHVGINSTSVTVDLVKGQLNVLTDYQRGADVTYATSDVEKTLSYPTAFFPANDFVSPHDIQNKRTMGTANELDPVDVAVSKKLSTLRKAHAVTQEYMMWGAVKGDLLTPSGKSLGNLYTDFGVTKKAINFELLAGVKPVTQSIREVLRHIEDNAYTGGDVGGVRLMVGTEFFDQLIEHADVADAYAYYSATNQANGDQPLRDDMRRSFVFGGVTFEEYRGKYQTVGGVVKAFVLPAEGWAFPTGVEDMFEIYHAPAHHIDYANTSGEEVYAWSVPMRDGSGIEIFSQSSSVAINRRPQAIVHCSAN